MNINYNLLAQRIVYSRYAQIVINECIRNKRFKIPIHLAMGHESIAESLSLSMGESDLLVCSHRNIHYHLAMGAKFQEIVNEFMLAPSGLSSGNEGSMNLTCRKNKIFYTSNILGNNLSVSLGLALSKKINDEDGIVFVVTGDGAIEEGSFYEAIENARNMDLPIIFLVENNQWSLASHISERRKPISLSNFAFSLGADYVLLEDNDPIRYFELIRSIRETALVNDSPAIIEVNLTTFGFWNMENENYPDGKYVNYHAGLAPNISVEKSLLFASDSSDPLTIILDKIGEKNFEYLLAEVKGLIFAS